MMIAWMLFGAVVGSGLPTQLPPGARVPYDMTCYQTGPREQICARRDSPTYWCRYYLDAAGQLLRMGCDEYVPGR